MNLEEFYEGGPKTWEEAFPPICVKARYDPTLVTDHILPKFEHSMAYDPRPSTRICYSYKSLTQENPVQPEPDAIFPVGGPASRGFPYEVYQKNVDNESNILRLNEPLTRCAERRYIPSSQAEVDSVGNRTIPGANLGNSSTLSPLVTEVVMQAGCRQQDDQAAWARSSRMFFNPTRYDRTNMVPANLHQAESRQACN
jgi:hypothetical protein